MKDIKDYLHLYLGCKCEITDKFQKSFSGILSPTDLSDFNAGVIYIKPILRPLSDMTEDEGFELTDILGTFTPTHFIDAIKSNSKYVIDFRHSFELTHYLLSKHFDLFNLIPEGLAIDKTKLINSTGYKK